mgnify:CR=1 FL=1
MTTEPTPPGPTSPRPTFPGPAAPRLQPPGAADPERTALQVLSAMEGLQLRWLNGSHDVDFVGEWKAIIDLLIP